MQVDHLIHSMTPCGILMGNFNDDIWAASPSCSCQVGLDDASLLGPLLSTPHHPDIGQYYTCIPRHGKPRRLNAMLVCRQIYIKHTVGPLGCGLHAHV